MGYKFKDTCYETQADAMQTVADSCGPSIFSTGSTTNSSAYFCKVNGSNIQFYFVSAGNSAPTKWVYELPMSFPSCTYSAPSGTNKFTNQDVIDMSWLVVSVWVVAWGIRKMIEVIRR